MLPEVTAADLLSEPGFAAKFRANTKPGKWGCIDWYGSRRHGYGLAFFRGRQLHAHRAAWMLRTGETVPIELTIDHLCCNKACVNTDHHEAVTGEENSRRIFTGVPGWIDVGKPGKVRRRVRATEAWKYTATGRLRKVA